MASTSKPFGLKIQGSWCRPSVENKVLVQQDKSSNLNSKTTNTNQEIDENHLYPEIIVKVEVNETDETIIPPEFNEENGTDEPPKEPIPAPPKKKRKRPDPTNKKKRKLHYYPCEICGQEFNQKYNMQRHKAIHVNGNHKCPFCGAVFNSQSYLDKHVDTKHDGDDFQPTDSDSDCELSKLVTRKKKDKPKRETKVKRASNRVSSESMDTSAETISTEVDKQEDVNVIVSKSECDSTLQNAIVSKMHKGVMIKEICRLYHVTPEVVKDIWSDRDKFVLPKKIPRRSIKYMNSVLEPFVLEWYNKEKTKNDRLTGKLIQDVAEKIAREKGLVHFTAGNKWLEQFKKKYNIYFNTRNRDYSNIPSESMWKVKFFEEQWSEIRPMYTDHQIYVGDEVGLFFNPSKSRERKFAGKKFVHGDVADRFSIFACTNVSGLHKRKLLVSCSSDPLKNSHRKAETLPVVYQRHPEGLITTYMYEEYVKKWNNDLANADDKAVLILDRASIHSKMQLSHLKFQYLPWKGVNGIMPIKNGIFARLRTEFRNLFLQFKAMNVVRGIDRHMTCLEGLEMLEKAWERTPPEVITKSYIDLGYEVQTFYDYEHLNEEGDKGDQRLCEHLKDYDVEPYYTDVNSLDMYLTVDEAFLVAKGTNPTLFGGNHKNTEPVIVENDTLPLNTNKPESKDKEVILRKSNALADLEIVRKYLLSNNTSFETFCNFLDVEKEVMENFVKLNS